MEKIKKKYITFGIILFVILIIALFTYNIYFDSGCSRYVPGYISPRFQESASVLSAREFVTEIIFEKYGFSEGDMKNPNFGSIPYEGLMDDESNSYLSVGFTSDGELKYGPNDEPFANLAIKISQDERVKNVYHNDRIIDYYRIYGIDFINKDVDIDKFTTDYDELVLFPEYIKITSNDFIERGDIGPGTKLFIYHTLQDELNFIQLFKEKFSSLHPEEQLNIFYNDYSFSFTVVFPPHYSYIEISEMVSNFTEDSDVKYDLPLKGIRQDIKVPEGSEKQWIKELEQYSIIESVERTKPVCLQPFM